MVFKIKKLLFKSIKNHFFDISMCYEFFHVETAIASFAASTATS